MASTVPGAWKASVQVQSEGLKGPETLTAETGWANQPDQVEMKSVEVNRQFLERLASETRGRVVSVDDVDTLASELPLSNAPVVEITSWPIWHQWWYSRQSSCAL